MFWRYAAAGLAIEAIYLAGMLGPFSLLAHGTELADLGRLTGYEPIAAILVTVALGGTALFSLTLVFLHPAMAIDVYTYAVQGHVAAFYHVNPLVSAPFMAGDDVFMTYAGTWAQSPSPYGPA